MKKILITGANSYIGTNFEKYLKENFSDKYQVDTLDMLDDSWKKFSFSGYDSIYHVAGIAHADTEKVTEERKAFYYKVNSDLTGEVARKAKEEGVKQFVFMSSSIVYGDSAPVGKEKLITKDTPMNPENFYGDSKKKAEEKLNALEDETFKVCILRPPMIYGKGSKGNFPILSKLAKKLSIFPKVNNSRSMLYIGNLVEFVRLMIENEECGVFWPQNKEYSNTSELVELIARTNGKKIKVIGGFTWAIKLMSHLTKLVNKAFGNLTYDQKMSEYKENYQKYTLEESIRLTEL